MGISNTFWHYIRASQDSKKIAIKNLIGEGVSDSEMSVLAYNFNHVRDTLLYHLRSGELKYNEYDYLLAGTYCSEIPAILSNYIYKIEKCYNCKDGWEVWKRIREAEISISIKYINQAHIQLDISRQNINAVKWIIRLVKYRYFRKNNNEEDIISGNIANAEKELFGNYKKRGLKESLRLPLGHGDFNFKIETGCSAISQLKWSSHLRFIKGVNDRNITELEALKIIDEYIKAIYYSKFADSISDGIIYFSLITISKIEALIAYHRLSKNAKLALTRIYVFRAACFVAYCDEIARKSDGSIEFREEMRLTVKMAKSNLRKAAYFYCESRDLWWHDKIWGMLGADLGVDLGKYEVLNWFEITDISLLINKLRNILNIVKICNLG